MNLSEAMTKLHFPNIRMCVWLFFVLVVIGPVCLGVGFASQLGSTSFTDRIVTNIAAHNSTPVTQELIEPVLALLKAVQFPLTCVFLFILGGSALAFFLFIRYFLTPMDNMAVMARRIAEGDLGESLPINSCVEIERIGESFNDLSTNLQEIILLVWNFTQDFSAYLDRMIDSTARHPHDDIALTMQNDLASMREKSQTLEEMITTFELYDVHVEGHRAIAATEPWREQC